MNKGYIAFGSNIGDRGKAIEAALKLVEARDMKIVRKSNIYETEPYGYTEQSPFMNGAIEVETNLSCREVLKTLLAIELELGRVREFRWGPRIIDLDIIFFQDEIYDEKDLKVPHPDMQNREFVLKPLCDIAQYFVHPVLGKTVIEIYEMLGK